MYIYIKKKETKPEVYIYITITASEGKLLEGWENSRGWLWSLVTVVGSRGRWRGQTRGVGGQTVHIYILVRKKEKDEERKIESSYI